MGCGLARHGKHRADRYLQGLFGTPQHHLRAHGVAVARRQRLVRIDHQVDTLLLQAQGRNLGGGHGLHHPNASLAFGGTWATPSPCSQAHQTAHGNAQGILAEKGQHHFRMAHIAHLHHRRTGRQHRFMRLHHAQHPPRLVGCFGHRLQPYCAPCLARGCTAGGQAHAYLLQLVQGRALRRLCRLPTALVALKVQHGRLYL